jgi:hypothetical protein
MDSFWAAIDAQLAQLEQAKTADDVLRILANGQGPDRGFFGGSGGDGSVYEALSEAGWSVAWFEAGYYWAMRQPDNRGGITYVEGDIMRGVQKPMVG